MGNPLRDYRWLGALYFKVDLLAGIKINNDMEETSKPKETSNSTDQNWFKSHPVLTGIFGFLILLFIIGLSSGNSRNENAPQSQNLPPASPQVASTSTQENQAPLDRFGDGTFIVGKDIQPGTYRNSGNNGCYYERLSGFGGTTGDIISNERTDAVAIVTILSTDAGFKSSRCGTWNKVSGTQSKPTQKSSAKIPAQNSIQEPRTQVPAPTVTTPTPAPTPAPAPVPQPAPQPTQASTPTVTMPPPPTSISTPQTDRASMLAILKANASSKWGNDYQMVQYEYNNQVQAYDWVMAQTAYPDIMTKAENKWGNDYQMVKYEYNNQVNAYKWIVAQTAYPDIMASAKQKWGDDYQMVKYEYNNQVQAYKGLSP